MASKEPLTCSRTTYAVGWMAIGVVVANAPDVILLCFKSITEIFGSAFSGTFLLATNVAGSLKGLEMVYASGFITVCFMVVVLGLIVGIKRLMQ